jgi:hypothetical protein
MRGIGESFELIVKLALPVVVFTDAANGVASPRQQTKSGGGREAWQANVAMQRTGEVVCWLRATPKELFLRMKTMIVVNYKAQRRC